MNIENWYFIEMKILCWLKTYRLYRAFPHFHSQTRHEPYLVRATEAPSPAGHGPIESHDQSPLSDTERDINLEMDLLRFTMN